ncbi:MAG: DNA-binding NarL/FixJ family response regulator, partial [Roseivirga sp.]
MAHLKILIVEDDSMISSSLKEILEMLNHEVVGIAEDADTAIDLCNDQVPDLALLDIQIGGDIDGVDLAEIINDQFNIPFIFTTAFADNATIARAKERTPYGYLVKPYGIEDINAAIEVAMVAY